MFYFRDLGERQLCLCYFFAWLILGNKKDGDYIETLSSKLKDKRLQSNLGDLIERIVSPHSIQLWKISKDTTAYNRFRDLLNGSLKNGLMA